MFCPYCGQMSAESEVRRDCVDIITLDDIARKVPSATINCDGCGAVTRVVDEKDRIKLTDR